MFGVGRQLGFECYFFRQELKMRCKNVLMYFIRCSDPKRYKRASSSHVYTSSVETLKTVSQKTTKSKLYTKIIGDIQYKFALLKGHEATLRRFGSSSATSSASAFRGEGLFRRIGAPPCTLFST